jgi:fumarate hydratase class I
MAGIVEREGVRLIVGKGGMGEQTRQACIRFGCIYVQAVGGAAALVARCVRRVHGVHFLREFGSAEAVWEMDVEGMEGIVTMDTAGGSLYDQVLNDSLVNLRKAIGRCPRVVR